MRHSTSLIKCGPYLGLLSIALLSVVGCTRTPRKAYDVCVRNQSDAPIQEITVKFVDQPWEFAFGGLQVGVGATYNGIDGMPPIPTKLTTSWRDESGKQHSVETTVDASKHGKQTAQRGELEVLIDDHDSVAIRFLE